jgi:hypothetical protein
MLTAKIESAADDVLCIDYRFTNDRIAELFVFNLLYRTSRDGSLTTDPQLAYVWPGDAQTTIIGKFLAPIPGGMKVEAPEIPFLQRVAPGGELSGMIAIRVPLARHRAYLPTAISRDPTGRVARLMIRIGFLDPKRFQANDAMVEPASDEPPGTFICDYGLGLARQEIAESVISLPSNGIAITF